MSALYFFNAEEGSYTITTAGFMVIAVIMLLVYITGISMLSRAKRFTARQLVFSAMALALAAVTSNIKLLHMPLGGSVTLMSMFFVTLIGYWYGLATGLCCAIAYGFLQMIMGPYVISLPQLITDYVLAFGALGLSGIFHKNRRHGMVIGYVFGVIGRCFFSVLSGVIFFAEYASDVSLPEVFRGKPLLYSCAYNGSYMGLEMLLTAVIISLPPVANALASIKKLAVQDEK